MRPSGNKDLHPDEFNHSVCWWRCCCRNTNFYTFL